MRIKKSSVICLIGTDGSGKSTLVKELTERYKTLFNADIENIYFGWKPFLPTTKLISLLLKKRDYKIAESMNKKENVFSFFQEVLFFYYYTEYLARYFFKIGRNFYKKKIIIVDRYLYDVYAHYDYAKKSKLFKILIKSFPAPDYVFFLDVDINTAKQRKPEIDINLLEAHRKNYSELSEIMNFKKIDTTKSIQECADEIVNSTKDIISMRIK